MRILNGCSQIYFTIYGICLIVKKNWKIAFIIEGILCILVGIFILSIDNILFDKNLIKKENKENNNSTENNQISQNNSEIHNTNTNINSNNINITNNKNSQNEIVIFSTEEIKEEDMKILESMDGEKDTKSFERLINH